MGDLLDLAERLEKKAKSVDKSASDAAVKVALTIVGDLAYQTPVDTSKALSNWIVTLDAPTSEKIKPHFPGQKGSTYRASAAETLADAKRVLTNKKPGQAVYISNNQPYIKRLNDEGYSPQNDHFVERAVLLGRKILEKFKFKD